VACLVGAYRGVACQDASAHTEQAAEQHVNNTMQMQGSCIWVYYTEQQCRRHDLAGALAVRHGKNARQACKHGIQKAVCCQACRLQDLSALGLPPRLHK
jgi:hypothetical protein